MMKEIGGYFELESFSGRLYHENAINLNCGRGCIKYLIELREIKSIWIPDYICDSVITAFRQMGVKINIYRIDNSFVPQYDFLMKDNEWLFLVDYYGQLSDSQIEHARAFSNGHIICDETQNFFRKPHKGIDTIYSCRKWFGVSDGGVLVTGDDKRLNRVIPKDESYKRMKFVLGRYERTATDFYKEASDNNNLFDNEPVKEMSAITENILRAIDYDAVSKRRVENWKVINELLGDFNQITLRMPEAPFMYPFFSKDANRIREKLIKEHIYIPVLWPNVISEKNKKTISVRYAKNILPLPLDQRYREEEMRYMVGLIKETI